DGASDPNMAYVNTKDPLFLKVSSVNALAKPGMDSEGGDGFDRFVDPVGINELFSNFKSFPPPTSTTLLMHALLETTVNHVDHGGCNPWADRNFNLLEVHIGVIEGEHLNDFLVAPSFSLDDEVGWTKVLVEASLS
ncbi:hypothetical protein KI387_037836, partial [Taxus chinensis]